MATATLPPEIQDLDDFNESINWLLYADSGVGKTVLAGHLPKLLILAIEPGTTSAKRFGSKAKLWKIRSWDAFERAYKWLSENPNVFEWVLIDSLTALQQLMIRWILDKAVENNANRDMDIPAIQDHYKWQQMMRRYVTYFNDLPVNVMYTAQAMAKEDPDGEDILLPLIQGKDYEIAAWVCAQMDILTYYQVKKVKGANDKVKVVRRLYGKAYPPFWAKDRFDALVPFVDDPEMPDLLRRIERSGSTTRTPVKKSGAKKATAKRSTTR